MLLIFQVHRGKDNENNFVVKKGSAECKEKLHERVGHWSRSPAEIKESPSAEIKTALETV